MCTPHVLNCEWVAERISPCTSDAVCPNSMWTQSQIMGVFWACNCSPRPCQRASVVNDIDLEVVQRCRCHSQGAAPRCMSRDHAVCVMQCYLTIEVEAHCIREPKKPLKNFYRPAVAVQKSSYRYSKILDMVSAGV